MDPTIRLAKRIACHGYKLDAIVDELRPLVEAAEAAHQWLFLNQYKVQDQQIAMEIGMRLEAALANTEARDERV